MEFKGVELPSAIVAGRLLILTGCRLNEIMTLKWAYVDFTDKVPRIPDSKAVHLGQPAVELLKVAGRIEDSPWVVTGALWKGIA